MEYMFQAGFLGTKAPLFMDMVTLIVAFLPLLVYGAILFARKRMYKTHILLQNLLFIFALVVIAYFELGVRVGGGFDAFMSKSSVPYTYALIVLLVHIFISIIMLYYWSVTIFTANFSFVKKRLPGVASKAHRLLALKSFLGIIFTSFSGVWVYLLLFVY